MFETAAKPEYRRISPDTARRVIGNPSFGITVVDVRTVEEYEEAHLPGAVLIPDYVLGEWAAAELPDKNAPIIVYCMSGCRAFEAARLLVSLGYTEVYDFGTIYNWPWERESGIENRERYPKPDGVAPLACGQPRAADKH